MEVMNRTERSLLILAVLLTVVSSFLVHIYLELHSTHTTLATISGVVAMATGTLCAVCLDMWRMGPANSHDVTSLLSQYLHMRCSYSLRLWWRWQEFLVKKVPRSGHVASKNKESTLGSVLRLYSNDELFTEDCNKGVSFDSDPSQEEAAPFHGKNLSCNNLERYYKDRCNRPTLKRICRLRKLSNMCHESNDTFELSKGERDLYGELIDQYANSKLESKEQPADSYMERYDDLESELVDPYRESSYSHKIMKNKIGESTTEKTNQESNFQPSKDQPDRPYTIPNTGLADTKSKQVRESGVFNSQSKKSNQTERQPNYILHCQSDENSNWGHLMQKQALLLLFEQELEIIQTPDIPTLMQFFSYKKRNLSSICKSMRRGECNINNNVDEAIVSKPILFTESQSDVHKSPILGQSLPYLGNRPPNFSKQREAELQKMLGPEAEESRLASHIWPCLRLISVLEYDPAFQKDLKYLRATYCLGIQVAVNLWLPASEIWGHACCTCFELTPSFQLHSRCAIIGFFRHGIEDTFYLPKQLEENAQYELVVTKTAGASPQKTGHIVQVRNTHRGSSPCFNIIPTNHL